MEINKTDGISGSGGIEPRKLQKTPPATPQEPVSAPQSDQVDISTAAQLISKVTSLPGVRQDMIEQFRQEILSGKYETPERLGGALEKFLSENSDVI